MLDFVAYFIGVKHPWDCYAAAAGSQAKTIWATVYPSTCRRLKMFCEKYAHLGKFIQYKTVTCWVSLKMGQKNIKTSAKWTKGVTFLLQLFVPFLAFFSINNYGSLRDIKNKHFHHFSTFLTSSKPYAIFARHSHMSFDSNWVKPRKNVF